MAKMNKTLGDKTYTWHRRVKKYAKKRSNRVMRRKLNNLKDI